MSVPLDPEALSTDVFVTAESASSILARGVSTEWDVAAMIYLKK